MSSAARKSVIEIIDKREVVNEKLLKSRKSLVEYDSIDNCLTHTASGSKKRFSYRQRSFDNMSDAKSSFKKVLNSSNHRLTLK